MPRGNRTGAGMVFTTRGNARCRSRYTEGERRARSAGSLGFLLRGERLREERAVARSRVSLVSIRLDPPYMPPRAPSNPQFQAASRWPCSNARRSCSQVDPPQSLRPSGAKPGDDPRCAPVAGTRRVLDLTDGEAGDLLPASPAAEGAGSGTGAHPFPWSRPGASSPSNPGSSPRPAQRSWEDFTT